MKQFTITETRDSRAGGVVDTDYTGTIPELVSKFGYMFEVGRSWQYYAGKYKVPADDKIRTIKTLVNALNNSARNRARNGMADRYYKVKEVM